MFGRTRPAVGLAWGPGLSEVLGGSKAGVTAACPWGGGGTWGTGTPAMGWRGAQGRQRRWAGQGPKAPLRVEKTAAGSGMSWRATVAAPPDGCPARSGSKWLLGAPLKGLRQRQKTTAGAARPAAGGRALIDERAGPLDDSAAQARKGERHEGPSLPIEEPAWVARKLAKRTAPTPSGRRLR